MLINESIMSRKFSHKHLTEEVEKKLAIQEKKKISKVINKKTEREVPHCKLVECL